MQNTNEGQGMTREVRRRIPRRLGAAAPATALAAALLAAPLAVSAPASAAEPLSSECAVTGGTLTWGIKESFRAYISSSIANGEWKASDGASYQTPEFTFGAGHGSYDSANGTGSVSFDGAVRFTGHEGVLNLTFANPTVEFDGSGGARLLLDATSNDQQGKLAIDEKQVPVGKIDAAPDASGDGTELSALELQNAEVTLTAEGAKAFAGFYPTGDALDPITLSVQLTPCAAGAKPSPQPSETPQPGESVGEGNPAPSAPGIPWLPIGLGAGALVVIAVASTLLVTGRKKPERDRETSGEPPAQDPAGE